MASRTEPQPVVELAGRTEQLLRLSLIDQDLQKMLTDMRKTSSGSVSETRVRMRLGRAIRAIRDSAVELQRFS